MANLGSSFDPNAVEPSTGGGGGLHPAGDFQFEIQESEVAPTKSGTGKVLKFPLVNLGNPEDDTHGADKGKKVYVNINVENANAQAQEIGQRELSAVCAAADFTDMLTDSEQLHYRPLWARIIHVQAEEKSPAGAYVKAFHADGSPKMRAEVQRYLFGDEDSAPQPPASKPTATAPAPAPAPAAEAAPAAGGARKWQRKAG